MKEIHRLPEQYIEMQGVRLGRPFDHMTFEKKPSSGTAIGTLDALLDALRVRFAATTGDEAKYPDCLPLNVSRYMNTAIIPGKGRPVSSRYSYLSRPHQSTRDSVVSFAINLYNSEKILPSQAIALVTTVAHLIKHNKVYISIFENASDDDTRPLLAELGAALQSLGVDGIWIHSSDLETDEHTDRIVRLSEIRNMAIMPLIPYASAPNAKHNTLVFLNDVATCAADILELVHQQRLQQADMAIATDWDVVNRKSKKPDKKRPRPYDMWTLRGIDGQLPFEWKGPGGYSPQTPNKDFVLDLWSHTKDNTTYPRWRQGLALPIYSGWGGMAAFDASLFTSLHLRFRATTASGWNSGSSSGLGAWGALTTDDYLAGDCPGASECELIGRDIWNLRQGRARIVLASQSRSWYQMVDSEIVLDRTPLLKRTGAGKEEDDADLIDWESVRAPDTVACIASRADDGTVLNTWSTKNHRTQRPPLHSDRLSF